MNMILSSKRNSSQYDNFGKKPHIETMQSKPVKIKEHSYKSEKEENETQQTSYQSKCQDDDREIITPEMLMSTVKDVLLIDTREIRKYKTGHIEGALSMNCTSRSMVIKAKKDIKSLVETKRHSTVIIYNENGDRNCIIDDFINFVKLDFFIVKFLSGGYKRFVSKAPDNLIVIPISQEEYEQHHFSPTNAASRSPDVLHATMTLILPYLYLGNEMDSNDIDILKEKGITHILNVTNSVPLYHENKFVYERLCASDSNKQDMRAHYEKAIKFIESARNSNGKVLVHCWAGVSRSATIVAAYLLKHTQYTVMDVIRYLKLKRPIVEPNFNFLGQLERFFGDLENGIEKRCSISDQSIIADINEGLRLDELRLSSNSTSSEDNSPQSPPISKPFFTFSSG